MTTRWIKVLSLRYHMHIITSEESGWPISLLRTPTSHRRWTCKRLSLTNDSNE